MRGRKGDCAVCLRPDVVDIDRELSAGASQRSVSRKYGHWQTAIRRHLAHRSLEAPSPAADGPSPALSPEKVATGQPAAFPAPSELAVPPAPSEADDASPVAAALRSLVSMHSSALVRYGMAQEANDGRLMAALLPELRRNVADQLALRERLSPNLSEHERLMAHPDFKTAITAVAIALDAFPDAREAVRLALLPLLGDETP